MDDFSRKGLSYDQGTLFAITRLGRICRTEVHLIVLLSPKEYVSLIISCLRFTLSQLDIFAHCSLVKKFICIIKATTKLSSLIDTRKYADI